VPVLAIALSFKQKHPGNNALARFQANQTGGGRATTKIFKNPHDVGSEYAVYMVGSPAKSAFQEAAAAGRCCGQYS
jgi:hypothetical protein